MRRVPVDGTCYLCAGAFAYPATGVPVMLVDPETLRVLLQPTEHEAARAYRRPLCPICAKKINAILHENNLPQLRIYDYSIERNDW